MSKIKAIILAGGRSVRLRPLTEEIPKSLIEIGGKTILERILDILKEFGFREVGIVINYKKELIKGKIGDKYRSMKIVYLNQEKPVGTANAVGLAEGFIGKEDFISINGDLIFDRNIIRKLMWKGGYSVVIALKEHRDLGSVGVVRIEGSLVKGIVEKPEPGEEPSKYGSMGMYRFSPKIFDAIKRTKLNPKRGEYELTDSMQILMNEDKVGYVICDEYWVGIETEKDLLKAKKIIRRHKGG